MRRSWNVLIAMVSLALALVLAFGQEAWAAPGDPDPSFSGDGRLTFNQGGDQGSISDVAIQKDGKIVMAGFAQTPQGDPDIAVSRLNPDGSLDQGFGTGGTVLVNVSPTDGPGGTRTQDVGNAVALQPDGKIVVAGSSNSGSITLATVTRLKADGTLDTSFNRPGSPAGFARVRSGVANDVAVDASGRIVIAGTGTRIGQTSTDSFVDRLNSDGTDDTTFGVGGDSGFLFDLGGDDGISALALQPDGRVILAGATSANNSDAAVARVIPGTGLDPAFGAAGKLTYGFGTGAADAAQGVVVEPGGKIDVGGYGSVADNFTLTRLTAGGQPDPSLNGFSTVFADFGGSDTGNAIALLANGKLVLGGSDEHDFALARFNPDGTPDATFGPGGKRTVSFPGTDSVAYAMAVQPDGRIVLAGSAGTPTTGISAAVARVLGDPPSGGGGGGGPGGSSGGGSGGGGGGTGGGGTGGGQGSRFTCGGRRATIVGTRRADKIRGTKHADVIVALGGNDSIKGAGGNDLICGGTGNDRVDGGSGNDREYGESGRDSLKGGSGNDRLDGGSGNDREYGQSGKDTLAGGSGNDRLDGGSGNDREYGQSGKDTLTGGPGNDRLAGGSGNDRLFGQSGKDTLIGGPGKDATHQ